MRTLAAAIDASIRSLLASEGERATHADAAVVVGESPKAWRAYVRGDRDPGWAKVQGWIAGAWVSGVRVVVTVGAEKRVTAHELRTGIPILEVEATRHDGRPEWTPTKDMAHWRQWLREATDNAIAGIADGRLPMEGVLMHLGSHNVSKWIDKDDAKALVEAARARVVAASPEDANAPEDG